MGRRPCCSSKGLNKGTWTSSEDKILTDYITSHGEGHWSTIPKRAGLKRCGKSCRLRWMNYLRPDIKRGNITPDEEELIIRLHNLLGNRWSLIAGRLPGRTDNEIKNYWNTNISKKIQPKQPHSQRDEGSSVMAVRTKASRCSEFFINSDLQQQTGIMAQHDKTIEASIPENSNIQTIVTNDHHVSSENLALVDDIDFLADLINSDFFMLPPPQSQPQPTIHHDNMENNKIDTDNTSGLLFGSSRHGHDEGHNELHYGEEFGSMNMLSDFDTCTTFDWVQDQPSN